MNKDCEECKGLGILETYPLFYGRPYYSHELRGLQVDVTVDYNQTKEGICHCCVDD